MSWLCSGVLSEKEVPDIFDIVGASVAIVGIIIIIIIIIFYAPRRGEESL